MILKPFKPYEYKCKYSTNGEIDSVDSKKLQIYYLEILVSLIS